MRMRRLELVVLALTLAFAFFMGGFFTGRNVASVSIAATMTQSDDSTVTQVSVANSIHSETTPSSPPLSSGTPATPDTSDAAATAVPQQPSGAPRETDGKININTASVGELTDLPGIGNVLAQRIVDYRSQNGSFAKIEDIRKVSGIGEKRYEAIMDLIKVG